MNAVAFNQVNTVSINWSVFSFELLIGLLVADGIHPYIAGVSTQMIVWKSWNDLLFNLLMSYLFFYFPGLSYSSQQKFYFLLWSFSPMHLMPILSIFNLLPCYSFFNSPFLWNTIPYNILKITQTNPYHSTLRHFLFWLLYDVLLYIYYIYVCMYVCIYIYIYIYIIFLHDC